MNNHDTIKSEVDRLAEKSQEAFILAIELFNRPTIKYRVEGCAFFLCNAWELMLKAYIIKRDGLAAISYKNKPDRTISLEDCLKRTMTNDKDPVRTNIETIMRLRNIGTHYVVPEYEIAYGPIFQASVRNYDDKLRAYLGIEICDSLPDNYLILSVNRTGFDERTLRARYPEDVVSRLLSERDNIEQREATTANSKYSATYRVELVMNKKEGIPIHPTREGKDVRIINKLVNPESKYPYRMMDILNEVNKRIEKAGIAIVNSEGKKKQFNRYHFGLIAKVYGLKTNTEYSHNRSLAAEKTSNYIYSSKTIDLIMNIVKNDPDLFVEAMKRELNARKEK